MVSTKAEWRVPAIIVAVLALVVALLLPTSASAAAGTDRLNLGESLYSDQSIESPSGNLKLIMQGDGNLVLYAPGASPRWQSGTYNNPGAHVSMQTDGNLVVYSAANAVLWQSQTYDRGARYAAVQNDGNFVVYTGSSTPVWQTQTSYAPAELFSPNALSVGQMIQAPAGAYRLAMQTDGNLVLYGPSGSMWQSGTANSGATRAAMQADGNLVLYNSANQAIWQTATHGGVGKLAVQDDGNLVIYTSGGAWTWQTYTYAGYEPIAPAEPAPPSSSCADVTGPVPSSSTAIVGGIQVHTCLSAALSGLLQSAAASGISLSGTGWRSHDEQIALRRQNCGGDVWQKSAYCSPPTAIPGVSMHERGLAIDFTSGGASVQPGTPAYHWLVNNASLYGLYNLPSESWHWSTDGH